jgi:predicted dehydrogenase
MATKTVRWGVLSTAGINEALVPGLLAARDCELVGIASRSADKAAREAQRWACRPYPSYEALLADDSIDVVYVPLPNHLHATWTIAALEAGKHVLCEKPLALTLAEVDAIAQAAERTGRLVLEAFMYRHSPRWQRAVELVRQGAVGDPRVVDSVFAFYVPSGNNIRFIPEAGGGIIWDMGCYASNMARGMLGQEPAQVFTFAEVRPGQPTETSVSGVMRFGEGRAAPFAVSFDYGNPFAQVEVVGTEGWLSLPGTGFQREPYSKILRHRQGPVYLGGREPEVEVFPFDDPYAQEVEHLSGAVRGDHQLAFGLDDARANTAVLLAMHESVRRSAAVAVDH